MGRLQRPHIAVLAVITFSVEAIDTIRQLRDLDRGLKTIILTPQNVLHVAAHYQRAGASALLSTGRGIRPLAFILRAIRSDYNHFDFVHAPIKKRDHSYAKQSDLSAKLTDRELMVFQPLTRRLSLPMVRIEELRSFFPERAPLRARSINSGRALKACANTQAPIMNTTSEATRFGAGTTANTASCSGTCLTGWCVLKTAA